MDDINMTRSRDTGCDSARPLNLLEVVSVGFNKYFHSPLDGAPINPMTVSSADYPNGTVHEMIQGKRRGK